MGVFFGNNNPASATYSKIVPSFNKRLNYWKQFNLSQIGKARVVEIFLASKLIYATKFYPIPPTIQKNLQKSIIEYINFPQKVHTIAQEEMWKTKQYGGIKLINIQIKSETSKAKWLVEIATNPHLKINLDIFTRLIGKQKGNIIGKDLIFLQKNYLQNQLKTESKFYKEALLAIAKCEIRKGIQDIQLWDKEHIFYNPLFTNENGKPLTLTKYCEKKNIYNLEQLLDEKVKESRHFPFDKVLTNMLSKIKINTSVRKEDILVTGNGEEIKFTQLTQKYLYEETLITVGRDHHSQVKWVLKLNKSIIWDEVWKTVHNILSTNRTKNVIWQQIHLNFYTQYSYNKWHKIQEVCPLCQKVPEDIYHIIIGCSFVNRLWEDIEPLLKRFHPITITEEEKAFGIVQKKQTTGILLRNWLTFLLRECIAQEEREAYHAKKISKVQKIKKKFNQAVDLEIHIKIIQYRSENNLEFLEKIITHADVLCQKGEDGVYEVTKIFN